MSSERRVRASQTNRARSHGPKTPEGKARSSYNAMRHGFLAGCVVLPVENRESFELLLQQHIDKFNPADDAHECLAGAFDSLAGGSQLLTLIHRYETRRHRMYVSG